MQGLIMKSINLYSKFYQSILEYPKKVITQLFIRPNLSIFEQKSLLF